MLVIIPARGGSKGVPRKNIRKLNGFPLIYYAINAALKCKLVSRVLVSTEDSEIAEIALKYGAEVPLIRPKELATDFVGNTVACLDLIEKLADMGETYSEFCLVQPTCPLISPTELDATIKAFQGPGVDAAITVTPFGYPIEAVFQISENGFLRNVVKHNYGATFKAGTRQSFGHRFSISGAVAALKVNKLKLDSEYLHSSSKVVGVVIDEVSGWDIDTELDLEIAQFLLTKRLNANPKRTLT